MTSDSRLETPAPPPERQDPDYVAAMREEALSLLQTLPMPSQETEEWRYTDISSLDLNSYRPFSGGQTAKRVEGVDERIFALAGEVGDRAGLLVQHNSVTTTAHLEDEIGRRGVLFGGLDDASERHRELIHKRLHELVPLTRTKLTALHAAHRTGGAFVYVPRGVTVELPLEALTYLDADGAAVFPHTLIVADEGSEVTFIDRFVSPDLADALSDAVTEIYAGPGARVHYVSLQEWGSGVKHFAVQRAELARDAELRTLSVAFGGELSRTEVETLLTEPGGYSEMLGVYFAAGDQHYDHRTLQDHIAPHCSSDLLYKGALKDASRAIYSGWVNVRRDAQKTNAFQTNRNIVLSDEAKADSIPNLEIEANDVRCGHAASVGPVDEDVLFYLQSRGISRQEAERLVVFGFFREVLDRVTLPEIRESLERAIERELVSEV